MVTCPTEKKMEKKTPKYASLQVPNLAKFVHIIVYLFIVAIKKMLRRIPICQARRYRSVAWAFSRGNVMSCDRVAIDT